MYITLVMGKHKEKSQKRKHDESEGPSDESGWHRRPSTGTNAMTSVVQLLVASNSYYHGTVSEVVTPAEEDVKKHKDKKVKKHRKEKKNKKDDEEKQLLKAAKKFLKDSKLRAPNSISAHGTMLQQLCKELTPICNSSL